MSRRNVGKALAEEFGRTIEAEHRVERRERQLVDAQRALERILLEPANQVRAADDDAGLRSAEQLVAAERDEVGARGDRRAHGRLVRQAPALQVDERTAAEIDRDRHAALAPDRREIADRHALREAADRVVARVHLHQQRRARADRVGVVRGMRAVRGADLDELRAGAAHDVGNAERAADLDQFAARDDALRVSARAC